MKQHLQRMSAGKCVYCEQASGWTIDHYRPKRYYPRRTFNWDNLNLACSECNVNKGDHFDRTAHGQPLLLNPTGASETADYFVVDLLTGQLSPNPTLSPSEQLKALATRDRLKLDRSYLADERRRCSNEFQLALRAYLQQPTAAGEELLLAMVDIARPYRIVIRHVVRSRDPSIGPLVAAVLQQSPALQQYLQTLNWI